MLSLLLAAAAAGTASNPSATMGPVRQARATVRIVRPTPIRFGFAPEEGVVRTASVRERDGAVVVGDLVEFY
jgi:hypothetical protein